VGASLAQSISSSINLGGIDLTLKVLMLRRFLIASRVSIVYQDFISSKEFSSP
jgi:hypothetical protein